MKESRTPVLYGGIRGFDVRSEQLPGGPPKACLTKKGLIVKRRIEDVDTLLLHQTGCNFGVSPSQIRAAGGDPELAQFMRAKDVHAHATAFDEGAFVIAFDLLDHVWHGNGANPYSIGLEGEGLFNGEPGGKTNGNPSKRRTEPTGLLIDTYRALCTVVVEEIARRGGAIRFYEPHRLHAKSRRSDPGWMVYREVGIEHCEKKLGLQPRPLHVTRDGLPVPSSWDPRCSAKY